MGKHLEGDGRRLIRLEDSPLAALKGCEPTGIRSGVWETSPSDGTRAEALHPLVLTTIHPQEHWSEWPRFAAKEHACGVSSGVGRRGAPGGLSARLDANGAPTGSSSWGTGC